MSLQPQALAINFAEGLDTKNDPKQIQAGKFLTLDNAIFDTGGLLRKRNGYKDLPALPSADYNYLTTFNGALTAIGSNLASLSQSYGQWTVQSSDIAGQFQRCQLSVQPIFRSNTSQTQVDSAIAPNGVICTVFTDQDPANLSNNIYKMVFNDSVTGQSLGSSFVLNFDPTYGTPRVFILGTNFIVLGTQVLSTIPTLVYFPIDSTNLPSFISISVISAYSPATTVSFDAVVYGTSLYIAWARISTAGIQVASLSNTLVLSSIVTPDTTHGGNLLTVTGDVQNNVIWVGYYSVSTTNGYAFALNPNLTTNLAPTKIISSIAAISNLTSSALLGTAYYFYEVDLPYNYDSNIPTHKISGVTLTLVGLVGMPFDVLRSLGLASKSFIFNGTIYMLAAYQSTAVFGTAGSYTYGDGYQDTYFLIDFNRNEVAKIAYGNGGGYLVTGLPGVSLNNDIAKIPYLFKDLIEAVSKNTNTPAGSSPGGVYSQLGINLVTFQIGDQAGIISAEIGQNLNLTGGFLWGYDGTYPVESGFFLYPDSVEVSTSTTGGSIPDDTYFYQVTYEWTDTQGNAFRSAPSVPAKVVTSGGGTSTNTIHVPSLRLTYKTVNKVKIVVYRWSVSQPIYYQTTSIVTPVLNTLLADAFAIPDTNSNAAILGNNIIYTNGGVLENIGPPACDTLTLFDDRLWLVDAEDKNLLWFSKQVLEATPVEMTDLLTFYVAPTIGAQGPTGFILSMAALDDKLILFKGTATNSTAIYYINGTGPDITGAQNQYSQPIFITSTVGCSNQLSIVFMPGGLMFEYDSPAGNQIWLLGRDLSTTYIGAPVQAFTASATVDSAVNIPGLNEVRFTMSTGITIVYNYFYQQWSTFSGVPAVSGTIYQGLHTYIDNNGDSFQETPGLYLDGTDPILMSFTTGWIKLSGVSGYQRLWEIQLLGEYFSPHLLNVQLAYDFEAISEQALIMPTNAGVTNTLEQWRIQQSRQKCQAFQVSLAEVYDPSLGIGAGQGFTLSGMTCTLGLQRGYRPVKAQNTTGTNP